MDMMITSSNTTTAGNSDSGDSMLTSKLFLPLVIGMVCLVVLLLVIILVMCGRKKFRNRNHKATDDIIITVVRQNSTDLGSSETTLEDTHSVTSRKSSISSITSGIKSKHVTFYNSTLTMENEENNDTDYAKRSQLSPPPIAPRPAETLNKLNRRKKEVNVTLNILDNKEVTLQRAANLFRSDTKAHKFYAQTKTNYEMSPNSIHSGRIIGKGHFGFVHEGTASRLPTTKRRNQKVAIKTMKGSAPDSEKQEFLYEIEIMRLVNSLNHSNIIKLLGCVTKTQPYMIVLELMPNGNLQRYLRDTKSGYLCYHSITGDGELSEKQLLQFALDIAKGMEGIADLQLLHRDLATRNILLDENFVCKVADFGFAKDVLNKPEYQSKSVFQRPRPIRWLPPESLFKYAHCIESDVWSFGIVLWEIVTLGNLPYPGMSTREVMKVIEEGYRMPCPPHCSQKLYSLMSECWLESSTDRPNFSQLVNKIKALIDQLDAELTGDLVIDVKMLNEDDEYIETLPTDTTELCTEYAAGETLC